MSKKVPCSYEECKERRVHWQEPYTKRPQQMIEVEDCRTGPAYCSITCAVMDKYMCLHYSESGLRCDSCIARDNEDK